MRVWATYSEGLFWNWNKWSYGSIYVDYVTFIYSWNGNTIRWYLSDTYESSAPGYQMNSQNVTYQWVAFG